MTSRYFGYLKTFCFLFAFLFAGGMQGAFAQSWAWAHSAGGAGDDAGHSIAMDASGNVFVAGYFSAPTITFGSTTLTNAGSSDIFLVKYDASGTVLWAKSAGGTGLDRCYAVTTDASGDVYITGYFESTSMTFGASTLANPSGAQDMFVAKYNASGTAIGAVNTGISSNEISPAGIAIDPSGNVYVTGVFGSPTLTIGSTVLTNGGSFPTNDMFIAKYNATGTFAWVKSAGGSDFEDAASVACDASGNIYVAGNFRSASITFGSTTLTNTSSGSEEIFLTKYDGTGSVVWAKRAGGASDEQPQSVRTDAAGNIYMSGIYFGSTLTLGSTTLTGAGSSDIFLAKYDASGAITWATGAGGTGAESAASVNTDASGNVYMTGYFFSPALTFGATTLTCPSGSANMYVVKYSNTGAFDWAASADGGESGGIGVVADVAGNVYVTGTFGSSTCTFGTTVLTNAFPSSSDMFIAKYLAPVAGHAPHFTGGGVQAISVCEDMVKSLNTELTATDVDVAEPETWSVIMLASHGAVAGVYSTLSTGTTMVPTGLMYTPSAGYTGSDSFKVRIFDGTFADTTLIRVTISPAPNAGAITGADSVCQADTIHLADAAPGGLWSTSSPLILNVGVGGLVTGLAPGTGTVRYIVTNGCGADTATHTVKVRSFAACELSCCVAMVKQVVVYPNPSHGLFSLGLPGGRNRELTLYDALGKMVIANSISDHLQSQTVDLSGQAPGNYLLRVVVDGEVYREVITLQ